MWLRIVLIIWWLFASKQLLAQEESNKVPLYMKHSKTDTVHIGVQLNNSNTDLDYATWITAIATLIYTFGTFLLWHLTRQSLLLTKKQIERNDLLLQNNAQQVIFKNFRELYSSILNNEEDAKIIANAQGFSIDDMRKSYLGSFFINHAYEMFSMRDSNLIPDDMWDKMLIDLKVLFNWNFVHERWLSIQSLYSKEFQSFINSEIVYKENI